MPRLWIVAAPLWLIAAMHFGAVCGSLLLGFDRAEFMAACSKDHKQYECRAMWRRGASVAISP